MALEGAVNFEPWVGGGGRPPRPAFKNGFSALGGGKSGPGLGAPLGGARGPRGGRFYVSRAPRGPEGPIRQGDGRKGGHAKGGDRGPLIRTSAGFLGISRKTWQFSRYWPKGGGTSAPGAGRGGGERAKTCAQKQGRPRKKIGFHLGVGRKDRRVVSVRKRAGGGTKPFGHPAPRRPGPIWGTRNVRRCPARDRPPILAGRAMLSLGARGPPETTALFGPHQRA